MSDQTTDALTVDVLSPVEAIRKRKTDLLFEYLKQKFELDRQLRLLDVSDQLAEVNRAHEQALNEVFLREAR